ncbi:MAG: hypothetical protein IIT39_00045 [Clostridia bacterium]|nr:hypothetical protein [Clostridia bacterium]
MKKRYVKTEMEIIEFDTEDIITASDGTGTGEGGSEDDDDGDNTIGG